jgi:hypothetical protein
MDGKTRKSLLAIQTARPPEEDESTEHVLTTYQALQNLCMNPWHSNVAILLTSHEALCLCLKVF